MIMYLAKNRDGTVRLFSGVKPIWHEPLGAWLTANQPSLEILAEMDSGEVWCVKLPVGSYPDIPAGSIQTCEITIQS